MVDTELAITDTDTYFRGPGEDRPAFPGLTLSVAGTTSHGADQGLDPRVLPSEYRTVAESCPPAVDTAHPDRLEPKQVPTNFRVSGTRTQRISHRFSSLGLRH